MDEVLSKTDQKIIMLAILCNPEGLNITKVDYNMLAEKGGYKTWDSARVKFGSAKRKLVKYAEECAAGTKPASPTKTSPDKVTKKTGGGGRKAGASPTKADGAKMKGKKVKKETADEVKQDDTEEESIEVKFEQA